MLRKFLRRYGVARLSAGLTLISIVVSVVVTSLITLLLGGGGPGVSGLTIAILAPLIIAPIMSLQMLILLNRLDQAETRLRALATIDELTQVYNRRHFITLAEAELARARRHGGFGSLVIIDLDNFKPINDTHGHLAGDALLRDFSRVCQANLRAGDIFARYGGDEFIMLLPSATPAVAHAAVERIRGLLAAPPAGDNSHLHRLRFSAGLAVLGPDTPSLDRLVESADRALYAAKRAGGNQVVEQAA